VTETLGATDEQLDQLRFLHRVARMATTASTWEELLNTVVDETRDALRASVSSLYLLDRDAENLTLAATNGLDRYQIGRARVPFGGGVTGRVAATREPLAISDVSKDDRFLWVRGIDQKRFIASMLSVPLVWNDRTVGVLNVQTEEHRDFTPSDVAHLRAIADLLGGIVEKGRMQREAEARATELKAIDEARAELIAMVTHELRTPLAVVRAYTELLAEEPPLEGRESRDIERRDRRAGWYHATMEQVARLDRLVDSILASVRVGPEPPADLQPVDVGEVVSEAARELAPLLARHRLELREGIRLYALTDPSRLRQILEHLVENAVKYAPPDTTIRLDWRMADGSVRIGVADEGPGIPEEWRERIFEPYARRETHTARGSGIGLYAARRLSESIGGRLWCEPAESHGARFVIALPAAAAM
jgi:signal transduction histidine kinase